MEAVSNTYDSIEDYTADVERARDAYAADEAVQAGLCSVCQERPKDRRNRRCRTCRRNGRTEVATA